MLCSPPNPPPHPQLYHSPFKNSIPVHYGASLLLVLLSLFIQQAFYANSARQWIYQDKQYLVFVLIKLTNLGASCSLHCSDCYIPPFLSICVFFARIYLRFLLADIPVLIFKTFQNLVHYIDTLHSYPIEVAQPCLPPAF